MRYINSSIPASGGSSELTLLSPVTRTYTYTSGTVSNDDPTIGTANWYCKCTNPPSITGLTVANNGGVTFANRGTTIGNKINASVSIILTIDYEHPLEFGGRKVAKSVNYTASIS
jgi:hypothetical protein